MFAQGFGQAHISSTMLVISLCPSVLVQEGSVDPRTGESTFNNTIKNATQASQEVGLQLCCHC